MNKHLLTTAIIAITLMLGGCQQSVEHRIKRGFKNYVQTTFDNPKDLLEIVSISDIPDTVSAVQIANMALSTVTDIEESLDMYKLDTIFTPSRLRSPNSMSYSDRLEVVQLNSRADKLLDKKSETWSERIVLSHNIKEMLKTRDYPIYYNYEIRARVKEGDKIKLKSYYAYTTNIDSVFTYKNDEFLFSDMSKEAEDLCTESGKLLKMGVLEQDIDHEYLDVIKKLKKLIVKE